MTLSTRQTGWSAARRPRSETELVLRQVAAIDAWLAACREAELAEQAAPPGSREQRLDRARRRDVVRRQHAAVVARTEAHLSTSAHPLRSAVPVRAVVAHRDRWFADRVCEVLVREGVEVSCTVDNGAEAVGATVAEQPDLLVVEDRLPMLHGADVLRQALPFAVATVAVAQASREDAVPDLLAAGARAVELRRLPPAELVARVLPLL